MRTATLFVLALVALIPCHLATPSACRAAPPEADPTRDYYVTPEAGPWMIAAAYYTGDEAEGLARQMVLQIRSQYHLNAYLFDYAGEERRKLQEALNQGQQPGARTRTIRMEKQWAVLIGGYPDMDSASRALKEIKKLKAPEIQSPSGAPTTDFLTQYVPAPEKKGFEVRKAPVNPFATAFVTRNPSVAHASAADKKKPDPFWKELNAGRPYNLLECKQPWTLAVKEFQGAEAVGRAPSNAFLSMLGLGSNIGASLDAAAKQAEEVARVLREMKFDAYVLHTRYSSIVTVGGYESAEDPRLLQ